MAVTDGVSKHLADAVAQMNQFQEINENTFRNFMIFSQLRIIELLDELTRIQPSLSESFDPTVRVAGHKKDEGKRKR